MDADDLDYLRQNPAVAPQFYEHFGYLPRDMHKAYPYIRIDLSRLMVEWLGTVLVGGLLWLAARPASRPTATRPAHAGGSLPAATSTSPTPAASSRPPPLESLRPSASTQSPNSIPPPLLSPTTANGSGPAASTPRTSAKLGREAAKQFNPFSWQMIVGILLIGFVFQVRLRIYPTSPLLAYGLSALTIPYFVWWAVLGCPPYLSRQAREYRRHCEQLDLHALERKITYDEGSTECGQWQITPKQRRAVLDDVCRRKLKAAQG